MEGERTEGVSKSLPIRGSAGHAVASRSELGANGISR